MNPNGSLVTTDTDIACSLRGRQRSDPRACEVELETNTGILNAHVLRPMSCQVVATFRRLVG